MCLRVLNFSSALTRLWHNFDIETFAKMSDSSKKFKVCQQKWWSIGSVVFVWDTVRRF